MNGKVIDPRDAIHRSLKIPGWYEDEELEALWLMCQEAVERDGVLEVGCFCGRTSSLFAQFMQTLPFQVQLTFIDPFLPHLMHGLDMAQAKVDFTRFLQEIGAPYRLIEKRTIDTAPEELPNRIDLVHIDGDHTKVAVEIDCELLLPLVRPGGIACFHDYGLRHFDVAAVVDEVCANWDLVGTFGTVRALRKRAGGAVCGKRPR